MREIKFRCWDTEQKGWVMPPAHQTYGETRLEEAFDKVSKHPQIYAITSSERFRFMQYTGLKDKNGTEIYESDLVDLNGDQYEIKYGDGCFWLYPSDSSPMALWQYYDLVAVKGNIYESR